MGDAQHNLPQRLSEVRTLANLSQSELAGKLGVSPSLISHWEKGTRTPSESQLLDLARHMGVALDYLLNAEIRPRFQPRTRTTSPDQNEIEHTLLDASQQVHFVDTAFRLAETVPPPFSLRADFDSFDALPNITSHLRDTLKLNRRVVLDEFKQALSEWNVFVFEWAMPRHLSGLSYRGPFTAIFINYKHPSTRRLFTLAHEFAHVVFHLDRKTGEAEERQNTVVSLASYRDPIEKQANAFASEFLMPKCDVEELVKKYGARLRDPASLETAARHFNVSRDAIFYRLTELGVFKWSEKSTYFGGTFPLEAAPTQRVETIDAQVDVRFRDTALSLHYSERISTGKLAEWFFAPRHVADGYLADLRKKQDLVISDQPADEDGELAGGE